MVAVEIEGEVKAEEVVEEVVVVVVSSSSRSSSSSSSRGSSSSSRSKHSQQRDSFLWWCSIDAMERDSQRHPAQTHVYLSDQKPVGRPHHAVSHAHAGSSITSQAQLQLATGTKAVDQRNADVERMRHSRLEDSESKPRVRGHGANKCPSRGGDALVTTREGAAIMAPTVKPTSPLPFMPAQERSGRKPRRKRMSACAQELVLHSLQLSQNKY